MAGVLTLLHFFVNLRAVPFRDHTVSSDADGGGGRGVEATSFFQRYRQWPWLGSFLERYRAEGSLFSSG